ncbi:MAG: Replication-associated recombination protein RarA [uncultured Chloroflexia bacterium]|uniref:Replication-associated recombination protein A n=1 Tax=uncultured Chloroflexia bacterium TaxID=1672391 RepID=A0A6J4HP72_9CHLR|nr:MAG: Replication-associated recombination protein RarA [uncultured Chloroflexia bacterium]
MSARKPATLFDAAAKGEQERSAPLAARMRPATLDEIVGQDEIIGPGTLLRRALDRGRLFSLILWGPPGTGKTTLARLLAGAGGAHFEQMSAVSAGVAELRKVVADARERRSMYSQGTLLFVDEIHRWNKAQQDAILPHVEDGTLTLVGATTENPSFEVNRALLSRCRVVTLSALGDAAIETIVDRALADVERGLGDLDVKLVPEARDLLVNLANGDARAALNALEVAALAAPPSEDGGRLLQRDDIVEAYQRRHIAYDKAGDLHFDAISALHKSVRDGDPDGALYWLARMLEGGEDPLYIARRVIRMAVEDIGMADPPALGVCVAAQQAVHFLGRPEGDLALGHAVVYLCQAPKSNAVYSAYGAVLKDVEQTRNDPVPLHLRNAPTGLMKDLGYGKDYQYAHDFADAHVDQMHLPPNLAHRRYYQPTGHGFEATVRKRLQWREQDGHDKSGDKEEVSEPGS